jgi:hypothetical protein
MDAVADKAVSKATPTAPATDAHPKKNQPTRIEERECEVYYIRPGCYL